MKTTSKVIRNSLWMSVQPIILNIVSIFVVGYIASNLGQKDYGVFVLAFSFVALFTPLCSLGLRAIAVRDMAEDRANAPVVMGKYFVLSLVLSVIAYALLVIVVNSMQYPPATKIVIYIAGFNLIFKNTATAFFNAFQAFEKMKFIALSNFISGALLTLFSVIVIYLGYRLIGITLVYVAGSAVLVASVAVYYRIQFGVLKLSVDVPFWLNAIKRGFPFFGGAMLWMLNMRISIVLLSKMSDDVSVGIYGAAYSIVSRLYIFPDSIGTAIFPTIAYLYAQKNLTELGDLSEKFFRYVLVIGLPFCLGLALLSPQVIQLIYGDLYAGSAPVLSILACGIPFMFLIGFFGFALGAVHLQQKVLKANIIATVFNVVITAVLIPYFGEKGAAAGFATSQAITSLLLFLYYYRFLPFKLSVKVIAGVILANALMGLAVLWVRNINLVLAIVLPGAAYIGLLFLLRTVTREDLDVIKGALSRRKKKGADSEE
jgi:O-antigen/teichoic acid export membrane protein